MHVWYVDKEMEELPAIRFVWFCLFHCFSSRIRRCLPVIIVGRNNITEKIAPIDDMDKENGGDFLE